MEPNSPARRLSVDADDLPDLTSRLLQGTKKIIGQGSIGTVWQCSCPGSAEFAVKAIIFDASFDPADKPEFVRRVRRELGIWRRLNHSNIVPLLGTAYSRDFGSEPEHPCMVSEWMPHGTLAQYVTRSDNLLSLPDRVHLVKGTTAGLKYLHSRDTPVVHGDLHPGNVLIDSSGNARITDFGLSQTLTRQEQLTYLWTHSTRAGARMWVAPELFYPDLFPNLDHEATLSSDIYSLGSIILFVLSGKFPWGEKEEIESHLRQFNNPPRPLWPVFPDVIWEFIERCWSPQNPINRPSAEQVWSFSTDMLKCIQPNPASAVNVVLFGALGSGKSSIINLLAEENVAPVSSSMNPCTKRPRCYQIAIGDRQFRLWDTTGFRIPRGGAVSPLLPYEQAHAVLRDIPDGVHLILLCARKDNINSSLRDLYWLINDFFFGGRAPVAFVVTHWDSREEKPKKWWELNRYSIVQKTGIPIQAIPRACVTTAPGGCDQSRQALRSLLATSGISITPHFDLSSQETVSRTIATHCGLGLDEATALVDRFSKPRSPLNVVLFGKTGAGKSSLINLITGRLVAPVSSDIESCTSVSGLYTVDTPTRRFVIWDTVGFNGVRDGQDMTKQAVMNAVRLIRDLTAQGGLDLLVFVKDSGKLNASEMHCYRLFEEFLCAGQVPVAVVVTHLEDHEVMEQWWETNGEGLLNALSGNMIGHACVTSLASHDPQESRLREKLALSKLALQALLEGFSGGRLPSPQSHRQNGEVTDREPGITAENLENRCGLARELAKEVIRLYNGSG